MKRILFGIMFFLAAGNDASGQSRIVLHYDNLWRITSPDRSVVKREMQIEPGELALEGEYKDFNRNNILIREGKYVHGKEVGVHKDYFDNGTLKSAITFSGESFVISYLADAKGQVLVQDGTGKFLLPFFYYSREPYPIVSGELSGEFQNGKRIGKWVYKSKQGRQEEHYDDGNFVKGTNITEEGRLNMKQAIDVNLSDIPRPEVFDFDHAVFKNLWSAMEQSCQFDSTVQRRISYPGGIPRLMRLIQINLKYPWIARRDHTVGKVVIVIRIDERGHAENYTIAKSVSPELDAEVIRLVKTFEDNWLPALANGKAYKSSISIPIAFSLDL